jgi:hypothetical protein
VPAAREAANATLVTLRLDVGTETITGTVATEQSAERRFWGWLELSEALDAVRGVKPEPDRVGLRPRTGRHA